MQLKPNATLADMWRKGASAADISRRERVSYRTVLDVLRDHGINPMDRAGSPIRKRKRRASKRQRTARKRRRMWARIRAARKSVRTPEAIAAQTGIKASDVILITRHFMRKGIK